MGRKNFHHFFVFMLRHSRESGNLENLIRSIIFSPYATVVGMHKTAVGGERSEPQQHTANL